MGLAKKSFLKNKVVKNILSAVFVAGSGFIILNLTFILDFLFQYTVITLIRLFTTVDFQGNFKWFPPVLHLSFVLIIAILSRLVFKSKLKTIFKVIYFTVPLSVIYVTIGIFFYRLPIVAFLLSAYFFLGFLYFFKRTKQSWLYYYALILVSLILLTSSFFGGEI
ncbi:hypothetical protein HZA76_00455 [Candidatus Roizmanbacteria bacterium]|nr:hypothetical protein [Candidatus Roizmanbacteria bacterium]